MFTEDNLFYSPMITFNMNDGLYEVVETVINLTVEQEVNEEYSEHVAARETGGIRNAAFMITD